METAYLLLGSNVGDRKANFLVAITYLSGLGTITMTSSLFETKAWGKTDQPDFLNQVVAVETFLTPQKLLHGILEIERQMGRQRIGHWGPRLIDIDILLIGDRIVNTPELTVPHSHLVFRRFALAPLAEIAGGVIHPETGISIQNHLDTCPDTLTVNRIA